MSKRQIWVVEGNSATEHLFIFDMCSTEESANAQCDVATRRSQGSQFRVVRYVPAEEPTK